MRECGLKCYIPQLLCFREVVTPRAGVWIEIIFLGDELNFLTVTPRAGVWIEISLRSITYCSSGNVTPRAGVWIEI